MPFESEKAFEEHIRELIGEYIIHDELLLFHSKKAVDILICRNGINPALFFLEVKYHKKNHGRLSIGHGKGGGFQPEILSKQPKYFEMNMRWVLGIEDMEGYFFMSNKELIERRYISNESIGEKYNNIRVELFKKELPLDEDRFIKELKKWVSQ